MRANMNLIIFDVRRINCRCFHGLLRTLKIDWLSRAWKSLWRTRHFSMRDVIRWKEANESSHYPTWINRFLRMFFSILFPPPGDRSKTKTKINQSTSAVSVKHRLSGSISKCHCCSSTLRRFRDGNKKKVVGKTRENCGTKINIILDFLRTVKRGVRRNVWK